MVIKIGVIMLPVEMKVLNLNEKVFNMAACSVLVVALL